MVALGEGPQRCVELQDPIGGISKKMLTQTLRRPEAHGLVERRRLLAAPLGVEYRLTGYRSSTYARSPTTSPGSASCRRGETAASRSTPEHRRRACGALARKDRPLSLEKLAEHAHVNVRTFTRRFPEEVGTSLRAG